MIALIVNQIGNIFIGQSDPVGIVCAVLLIAGMVYMLVRPYKESTTLKKDIKVKE